MGRPRQEKDTEKIRKSHGFEASNAVHREQGNGKYREEIIWQSCKVERNLHRRCDKSISIKVISQTGYLLGKVIYH